MPVPAYIIHMMGGILAVDDDLTKLGNGVTVARLTLDQLVGVQIPIPQLS